MKKTLLTVTLLSILTACVSTGPKAPKPAAETVEGAVINVKLATGYIKRGEYEIALEKLKRALQFDPNYAMAHTVIGVLYGRIGDLDKAGTHYKRAVELSPNDGGVLNNYAQYLCQMKQYQKAYPYFKKAVEQPFYRTPASALSNAGRCSIDEGDLDSAEAYLRQAIQSAPGYPPALLSLARLMNLKGDYLKARAFLERFHASGQVTPNSLHLGYDIELELGDTKASEEYRSKLIQQFPDSPLTKTIM